MRLGISSYTYTWAIGVPDHPPDHPMSALDLLDRASELGVSLVQVADNLPLDRMSEDELCRVEERSAGLGIDIEVGTRGIAVEHLRSCVALAHRFRSSILRVVVDTPGCEPTPDEVANALRTLAPELAEVDVCLAIENHDRFPARVFAEIVAVVNSPNVGICLDTANSFGALEGPDQVLEVLGPLTVNLHAKDFVVRRVDSMMGFVIEGRPAGKGMLDLAGMIRRLRDLGRDPNVILEQWTPPEESLADTIRKEAGWARESVDYLQTVVPGKD